jgi:hypothetical protein
MEEKSGNYDSFFQRFCGVLSGIVILCSLQTGRGFFILLQRGIAIPDCEAAALPGRFLPELGRSSERPFFFAGLLRPSIATAYGRIASLPLPTLALGNPAQATKSLAKNSKASVRGGAGCR